MTYEEGKEVEELRGKLSEVSEDLAEKEKRLEEFEELGLEPDELRALYNCARSILSRVELERVLVAADPEHEFKRDLGRWS